jgi:hypothetical protein
VNESYFTWRGWEGVVFCDHASPAALDAIARAMVLAGYVEESEPPRLDAGYREADTRRLRFRSLGRGPNRVVSDVQVWLEAGAVRYTIEYRYARLVQISGPTAAAILAATAMANPAPVWLLVLSALVPAAAISTIVWPQALMIEARDLVLSAIAEAVTS